MVEYQSQVYDRADRQAIGVKQDLSRPGNKLNRLRLKHPQRHRDHHSTGMILDIALATRGLDPRRTPFPENFFHRRLEDQRAPGTGEFVGQEIRKGCVAGLDAKQAICGNCIFRGLLPGERCDGNAALIGGIEALDVVAGRLRGERIQRPAIEVRREAEVAAAGLRAQPLPHLLQHAIRSALLRVGRRQAAAIEPERGTIDFEGAQSSLSDERPGLLRQAVNKFSAQLNGHRERRMI